MSVTLREIQQKLNSERESSDLQHLEEDFYTQVGQLLDELYEERNEYIKTTNNPFQSKEIQELSDKIQTIENTVDALYQQRSGKIIDKAGFAAADMIDGINGATKEEEELFNNLVEGLNDARKNIATTIDEQRNVTVDMSVTSEQENKNTESTAKNTEHQTQENTTTNNTSKQKTSNVKTGEPAINIDSDNLLSENSTEEENKTDSEQVHNSVVDNDNDKDKNIGTSIENRRDTDDNIDVIPDENQNDSEVETTDSNTANIDRITVEIETSIGKIVGTDNREYMLEENDVVTLPKENASALINKDAAKKIDG